MVPSDEIQEIDRPSSAALTELVAYWESKRHGAALPTRSAIEPTEIPRLLSKVFLVEVLDGGEDFRYRLAGTEVDSLHGQSLSGKRVGDISSPEVASLVRRQYQEAVAAAAPSCHAIRVLAEDGKYWSYERVLLPLTTDGRTISLLLGGVAVLHGAA